MWRYWLTWPASKFMLLWFRFSVFLVERSKYENPTFDPLVVLFVWPFVFVDVIYNYTFGAFVLWEWHWRDVLFTTRLNRLAKSEPKNSTRYKLVVVMGTQLNEYDPGHVRF